MRKLYLPILILVASGAYYLIQACPSFYFWDSAELTAAVLINGVPHPPGFPLLLLLGKIWNLLTPFDKTEGLNFLSAIFASAGLTIWYLVVKRVMRTVFNPDKRDRFPSEIISLICVALLGISFSYTIQATRFEVYSLNFLTLAAAVYLSLRIIEYPKLPVILFSALFVTLGLSLGAHILTAILVFPGIFLLLYLNGEKRLAPLVMGCLGSFAVAALLYSTIYFAAASHPPLNWGDPSTIRRFFDYFFVREFSVTSSSFNVDHLAKTFSFAAGLITSQFGAVGTLMAVIGIIYVIMKKAAVGVPLLLIMVLNGFSTVFTKDFFYENLDLHGYDIIFLALAAMFMAVAFHLIYLFIRKNISVKKERRAAIAVALTIIAAIFVFFIPVKDNFMAGDLSDIDGRYYANLYLESLPDDAVVLTSYYNTYFSLMAALSASNDDRGISLQCVYNWDHPWGKEQAAEQFGGDLSADHSSQNFYRDLLNRLMKKRIIYVEYDQSSRPLVNYLVPDGLLYRFSPDDSLSTDLDSIALDISDNRALAFQRTQIEWIRSWVYWFSGRAKFYTDRGKPEISEKYISAMNEIAARSRIR